MGAFARLSRSILRPRFTGKVKAMTEEEGLVRYQVRSGRVYYKNKPYKPGEIIKAPPGMFTDFEVECLDAPPPFAETPKDPEAEFKIQLTSHGWYNVIDVSTGEPINDKALRKDEAEELLGSLIPAEE